jgi:hypothetical protein
LKYKYVVVKISKAYPLYIARKFGLCLVVGEVIVAKLIRYITRYFLK